MRDIQGADEASCYHISLTPEEARWLSEIDFECGGQFGDGHAAFLANQKPVLALLASLQSRDAIPQPRIRYWTDPDYKPGRTKGSRRDMFVRDGNQGDEIYTHPNFLRHLKYFLFGPDLPAEVIAAFEKKVGNPRWVSSSDIVPMARYARQLSREYRLGYEAADEFFKLCLDMGLSRSIAGTVREITKRAR